MGPMMAMTQEPCSTCSQTGKKVIDTCGSCAGKRVAEQETTLDVVIKPGMQEGDRLTFAAKCSESPHFERPGDVILVIRSTTGDETWTRKGADLTTTVRLSLAEALLGWERTLANHPSGKPLHIVWKEGALREGEVLRITGWGMPFTHTKFGDLRIVCTIEAHQGAWSEEQRCALKNVWPDWKEPMVATGSVVPLR
jgi:DnaJ-class molecular chaperone